MQSLQFKIGMPFKERRVFTEKQCGQTSEHQINNQPLFTAVLDNTKVVSILRKGNLA
jgi:hypothetical protein